MLRAERFFNYFLEGTDKTLISCEMPYFKTALVIDTYISQPDSTAMIDGIYNDESVLLSFRQYSHQHFFSGDSEKGRFAGAYGTLLYAILTIEDYCFLSNPMDDEERLLIDIISNSLKNLYHNYNKQPTLQLNQLMSATNQWFTIKHQNPEQAKQLTLSFFATLSIGYQAILKIDKLPWDKKYLITSLIAIEPLKNQLEAVLETARTTLDLIQNPIPTIIIPNDDGSIENSTRTVRPVVDRLPDRETEDEFFENWFDISEPVANHQEQNSSPLLTIDAYYDKQSLDILKQSQPSLSEKIRLIKTIFDNASGLIETLLADKNQRGLLDRELDGIQTVLINQDAEQEATQGIPIKLYDMGFFFSAFVSSFVEINTPEIIRAGIASMIPESALPPEIQRLSAIVGTCSDKGQPITTGEIQILERQINHTVQILAGENNELRQLFIKASNPELSQLSERMQATSELMNTMAELIDTIKNNQITLKKAKMIDAKLDDFILQHDGILVTISLILSHYIHSFFKTDTATKIESARLMKEELSRIKLTYQTNINDSRLNIQNSPIIPALKETIATDLGAHEILPDTEETTSGVSTNIQSQFSNINTLFRPLKTQHEAILTNMTYPIHITG